MRTYYFDLDHTLIDTTKLVRVFIRPKLAEITGKTVEELDILSADYYQTLTDNTQFTPDAYAGHLANKVDLSQEEILSVYFTPAFFKLSLFADTLPTLNELRHHTELYVYTQSASDKFQQQKVELSGLGEYFPQDKVIVSADKTQPAEVQKLKSDSTFIDDRLKFLNPIADQRPDLKLIWLNRNQDQTSTDLPTITTLEELL